MDVVEVPQHVQVVGMVVVVRNVGVTVVETVAVPQYVQVVGEVVMVVRNVGVEVVAVPPHVQVVGVAVVVVVQNVGVVVIAVVEMLRNVGVVIAVEVAVVVVLENKYLICEYHRIKNHNKDYYLNISGDSWILLKNFRNRKHTNKEEKIGIFRNFFFLKKV